MSEADPPLPAPALLAITYAPKGARLRLSWLLAFDLRLAEIGERAREPMIAQLRLAWWRDVLAKPVGARPKGEPLLAQLGDDILTAQAAARLVDAHELYFGDSPAAADDARTKTLEEAYSDLLGIEFSALSTRQRRPLSILALARQLEKGEATAGLLGPGVRLVWHALTGR